MSSECWILFHWSGHKLKSPIHRRVYRQQRPASQPTAPQQSPQAPGWQRQEAKASQVDGSRCPGDPNTGPEMEMVQDTGITSHGKEPVQDPTLTLGLSWVILTAQDAPGTAPYPWIRMTDSPWLTLRLQGSLWDGRMGPHHHWPLSSVQVVLGVPVPGRQDGFSPTTWFYPQAHTSFPRFSRADEGVDDGRRQEETARASETCALCFYWGPAWGRPKEFGSIDKLCIYLRQVLT